MIVSRAELRNRLDLKILYASTLDYSQCVPGTAAPSSTAPSAPSSPTAVAGALPKLGGVNTAGYDFSIV